MVENGYPFVKRNCQTLFLDSTGARKSFAKRTPVRGTPSHTLPPFEKGGRKLLGMEKLNPLFCPKGFCWGMQMPRTTRAAFARACRWQSRGKLLQKVPPSHPLTSPYSIPPRCQNCKGTVGFSPFVSRKCKISLDRLQKMRYNNFIIHLRQTAAEGFICKYCTIGHRSRIRSPKRADF